MNPKIVEEGETLGHGAFSSGNARRKRPRASFYESAIAHGMGAFSVDRLDFADIEVLCDVHDDDAKSRGENRSFYGWYYFTSDLVRSSGMGVSPTPSEDSRNIWHADVTIPKFSNAPADFITKCANALTAESRWQARPLNRMAREDIEQASASID